MTVWGKPAHAARGAVPRPAKSKARRRSRSSDLTSTPFILAARVASRSLAEAFAVKVQIGIGGAATLRVGFAQNPRCGEAIHRRHLHVHEHEVVRCACSASRLPRFGGTGRPGCLRIGANVLLPSAS
jgi:hypothetical protein